MAHLRAAAGSDLDDPRLTELVDELSFKSADFRRLGPATTYPARPARPSALHHRDVGDLTLSCEVFNVNSAPGQQLLIFQAEPGSPSEHALALLGSLSVMTA